jgi:hypothetical protein
MHIAFMLSTFFIGSSLLISDMAAKSVQICPSLSPSVRTGYPDKKYIVGR